MAALEMIARAWWLCSTAMAVTFAVRWIFDRGFRSIPVIPRAAITLYVVALGPLAIPYGLYLMATEGGDK